MSEVQSLPSPPNKLLDSFNGRTSVFQTDSNSSILLSSSSFAVLAQSVEHLPCKQDVVSSIPTDSTKHGSLAHLVERQLCKLDVIGSNPIGSTKIAVVAELVDASVLEADVLWRESSSLSDRTNFGH